MSGCGRAVGMGGGAEVMVGVVIHTAALMDVKAVQCIITLFKNSI